MEHFLSSVSGGWRDVPASMLLNNFQKETIVKKSIFRRFTSLLAAPLIGLALTLSFSVGAAAQPVVFFSEGSDCSGGSSVYFPEGGGDVTASLCAKDFDPNTYICDFSVKFTTANTNNGLFAVEKITRNSDLNDALSPTFPWAVANPVTSGRDLGGGATDEEKPVPAVGSVLLATYEFSVASTVGVGPYQILTSLLADGYRTVIGTSNSSTSCDPGGYTSNNIISAASLSLEQASLSINSDPADVSAQVGGNATFNVIATGNPAVTDYQWQVSTDGGMNWTDLVNGSNVTGANDDKLRLSSVTSNMSNNQYRCIVSNGVVSKTSNPATLMVRGARDTSATESIPVLSPAGLVLLAFALGGLAFRQRRRV